MSDAHGALCLIERASAQLCRATAEPVELLCRVLSAKDRSASATEHAARALVERLRLCHAAWSPGDLPLSLAQLAGLAAGLPDHVTLDLSALPPATIFAASFGRIVLNLLLLAAEALPEGGSITLAGSAQDLFVQITGHSAAWPAGTALCLTDPEQARSALTGGPNLQLALTALLAHSAGIRLSMVFAPASLDRPAILRLGG